MTKTGTQASEVLKVVAKSYLFNMWLFFLPFFHWWWTWVSLTDSNPVTDQTQTCLVSAKCLHHIPSECALITEYLVISMNVFQG